MAQWTKRGYGRVRCAVGLMVRLQAAFAPLPFWISRLSGGRGRKWVPGFRKPECSDNRFTVQVIQIPWTRYVLPPLHEEGPRFLAVFAIVTALLFWAWWPLGIVGCVLTVWCYFFFRDPVRYIPSRPGLVMSPASGVVQMIGPFVPPPELGMGDTPMTRVSVFMSVFDCHVNRMPIAGEVLSVVYRPGLFLNATLDKASDDNERSSVRVKVADGREIAVVQIAGLVARRIRCDIREGQSVSTGERFGLIRFGSRLDVYLPEGVNPLVVLGQSCVSGETIIADMSSDEAAREGSVI